MPVLVYSLLRILLIVAAGGGLYLAGMRGVLLVVAAVLVGAGLSYVLLDKFRRASAEWLASRGRGKTGWEDRIASDADDEDALLGEEEDRLAPDADDEDAPLGEEAAEPDEPRGSGTRDSAGSDEQRDEHPKADG
ncbi:DUF4229 domain-containing protein [Ruania zhangjianzhongii]|uniref:DUF4229 domain-containing protein n=1 Tax=Ruania zhangjianzhongii TaxID=2603206 RepID=UPI0011CABD40|nr:DUF4229 domain-containing protein [Ruania zhangjianzhongii]